MMTYYQGKVSYFLQRSKQTFIIKTTEEGIALDSVLDERVVTRLGKMERALALINYGLRDFSYIKSVFVI